MLRNLRTSKLLLIAATTSLLPITTLKPSNCDYYQERPGVEDTFIPDASTTKGHHTFHSYKRRRAPTFEERKMRKEMSKEMIFTGSFPKHFQPSIPAVPSPPPLFIVSYSDTDMDSFEIAAAVSLSTIDRFRLWLNRKEGTSLTSVLTKSSTVESLFTPNDIRNSVCYSVLLRAKKQTTVKNFFQMFYGSIPTKEIELFYSYFQEFTHMSVTRFEKDDVIGFYWMEDGSIMLTLNDGYLGKFYEPNLYKTSLRAFSHTSSEIAPSLTSDLVNNILKMRNQVN